MVAVGLWKHTAKIAYLEAAHHILFNGLGDGQRPNGGFGCDNCAGAHDLMLSPKSEGLFEAFWCCTMRGAEGLSRALQYSYHTVGNQISIPFYEDSLAQFQSDHGTITLKQTTSYPIKGSVMLEVIESALTQPITIRFYAPSIEEGTYRLAGSNAILTPINDLFDKSIEAAVANRKQVLFK